MDFATVPQTRKRVIEALDRVYDPELDEAITTLGFVRSCTVDDDLRVTVVLRLPTPQCAPNFAFLMASDARRAIERDAGLSMVEVRIEDHCTGAEINAAVNRGLGFVAAFPGESTDDELTALRELFQRKALVARQAAVCNAMVRAGVPLHEVVAKTVAELPRCADAARCLELRAALGIATAPEAPGLVTPDGRGLQATGIERWLRMARLIRTSLETNGGICRSLLATRDTNPEVEVAA